MKNIYSNIFKFNNKNISKASGLLKKGGLVGVPTETVYGVAANAYSNNSIRKVYKLKKRPYKNPLIIHYLDLKDLIQDVELNKNFFKLYKKFCPGPITFVLNKKKTSNISKLATANLDTVAVRFPKNQALRKLLKKINFPLAIPSANKSSGISPVNSIDVYEEFGKKLKIILNGGTCKIGIESTVVDLTNKIKILRPGAISQSQISKEISKRVSVLKNNKYIKAPGALKKHYSPNIPMKLNQKKADRHNAFITFGNQYKETKNTYNLSRTSNLKEAGKNLYKILRTIKNKNYKKIFVAKIPSTGIGFAINDRLKHAAAK
ncbi:MAG: L-threonylcarbamoyladenylate synthase [Pelagibacterales bacterium]|jgi:L-threonylcarbamoyladenylate synthase|nr:L-threonylcarbamoyladenylate synthase [Pelagibacterales bacterium]